MTEINFPKVAEKKWNTLYRVAFSYYGNKHDAEDTVQDAMLKLYKDRSKTFENREHVRNWLIRVTVNSCKTVLRIRDLWRERRITAENMSEIAVWESPEHGDFFLSVMSLPKQHRTVLHLYYYEDYSTKEIAEIMGQKEAHIRVRLSRARRKLREVWRNER